MPTSAERTGAVRTAPEFSRLFESDDSVFVRRWRCTGSAELMQGSAGAEGGIVR
jgi:hypothetical protein